MTPISHPVRRSVVTNIAGSVDATLTGDGGTPIAGADVVGGLTTKTVAFAAGETLKYATWDIVDDSAVEGTEGYKVTLSNPQPSGTLSVPSITGTVGDNDTGGGGGGGTSYGPQDTVLPKTFDTQSTSNFAEFVFTPSYQAVDLYVGDLTGSGADCIKLKMLHDSGFQIVAVRGGNETVLSNPTLAPATGQRIRITQHPNKDAIVTLDGAGVTAGGIPGSTAWPSGTPGTWTRAAINAGTPGATKGVALGALA